MFLVRIKFGLASGKAEPMVGSDEEEDNLVGSSGRWHDVRREFEGKEERSASPVWVRTSSLTASRTGRHFPRRCGQHFHVRKRAPEKQQRSEVLKKPPRFSTRDCTSFPEVAYNSLM